MVFFEVRHKNEKSIKNKKNVGVRFEMCDTVTFILSVLSPCIAAADGGGGDDESCVSMR